MKTRTKGLLLDYHDQPAVAADLAQVVDYLEQPNHLPRARAIAIFASRELGLFEVLPLPHVHRSRLAVSHEPLVRELLGLEEEFGTILAVVYDRTAARVFEVTAYDCTELPGLASIEASGRGSSMAAAPGNTTTTSGFGRRSSGCMRRSPIASSRSIARSRWRGSFWAAWVWTPEP